MEVADTFVGRSVFITGATGFMGKVLVEKLLRSCPDLNKIYALVRPGRNGESSKQKLNKIHSLPLFDRLKAEYPGVLESKLLAIEGDASMEQLGMSIADRQMLIKEVSIVYHVAATVRFDQPLQQAILINVRSTKDVCELVLDMRKQNPDTILLHVSTAYAHSDRKVIKEQLYPPHADWRWAIQIAESLDQQTTQILSLKMMENFPNTYTFTKSMGEHVVNDLCGQGGNTVIVRPSVVTNTHEEPFSGWVDNMNGPIGIMSAISTGIVRIIYADEDSYINYIPVDTAIKMMILATWRQFLDKKIGCGNLSQAKIYNCCLLNLLFEDMRTYSKIYLWKLQLNDTIWFPSFATTINFAWFYTNFMLFQLLPAIIIDCGLLLFGKSKRSLVKIQRKVYVAFKALAYFSHNNWDFKIDFAMDLENYLPEKDIKIWGYHLDSYNAEEYLFECCKGVKKFVMKEEIGDSKKYLKKRKIMYYWDYAVKAFFMGALISIFYTESIAAQMPNFT